MARFDVFELSASAAAPLVVDVQADLLNTLRTRVVVPILPMTEAGQEVASVEGQRQTIVDALDFLFQGF